MRGNAYTILLLAGCSALWPHASPAAVRPRHAAAAPTAETAHSHAKTQPAGKTEAASRHRGSEDRHGKAAPAEVAGAKAKRPAGAHGKARVVEVAEERSSGGRGTHGKTAARTATSRSRPEEEDTLAVRGTRAGSGKAGAGKLKAVSKFGHRQDDDADVVPAKNIRVAGRKGSARRDSAEDDRTERVNHPAKTEPVHVAKAEVPDSDPEPMTLTHHNRKVHHAAVTPDAEPNSGGAGVQPIVYRRWRGGMPAPLKGSHAILVHQNEMADADGLERVQDDDTLQRMREDGTLVAIPVSAALVADGRLPADRRYTRPWTSAFLTALAREHASRFGGTLQVNSAVRTVDFQVQLIRRNGNAAPADGDTASPHLTGQAVDLAKHGLSAEEIGWMRAYLLPLIEAGKIDVEEEFQQACFHISVYRSYLPPVPPKHRAAPVVRLPVEVGEVVASE